MTEQQAKDYILQRVNAERAFKKLTARLLKKFAKQLVSLVYSCGGQTLRRKIEELIGKIKQEIIYYYEAFLSLCANDYCDDDDDIKTSIVPIAKPTGEITTLQSEISQWINQRADEIECVAEMSAIIGATQKDAEEDAQLPFFSDDLLELKDEAIGRGWKTPGYWPTRKSYQWRDTDKKIQDLATWSLSLGWMASLYDSAGAQYWQIGRGSSYPCSLCDDECGYIHNANIDPMPPFHNHCCCYAIPLNNPIPF